MMKMVESTHTLRHGAIRVHLLVHVSRWRIGIHLLIHVTHRGKRGEVRVYCWDLWNSPDYPSSNISHRLVTRAIC